MTDLPRHPPREKSMTVPADPPATSPAWPAVWGEGLYSRTALLFWLVLKAQNDQDAQALVAAFEADILDIAHHLNDVMLGMDRGHGEDYARGWNAANKALYDKLGPRIDELRDQVRDWQQGRGTRLADQTSHTWTRDGITASELLHTALPLYAELAGARPFDLELTTTIADTLAAAIADDATAYTARLRAFTAAHRSRIEALLADYGPGSSHDRPGGRFQLARQPELLPVLERLHTEPLSLLGAFEDVLPSTLLLDLAAAWGVYLPERP
ncbi:hypothetical protein ACWDRR_22450 [Kitasatospora sp. NPDC003701]